MTHKQNALSALMPATDLYNRAKEQAQAERICFVRALRLAKLAGATQQEIADVVGLSRQRVSQFLAE